MIIDFSKNINLKSLSPKTEFEEKVIVFLEEWFSDSETVSVQTSGSTGKPKILEVEKKRMLSSAKMTCDFLQLSEGHTALLCLPVEYISGKMMIVRAIERMLKLHVVNPTSKPLENFSTEVDFCAMSPLQVDNSLDQIHLIRNLIIGGAQVSENLKKRIADRALPESCQIFETYGMSETLSHIALKRLFPNAEEYFTVLEDVKISNDERGCLTISAPKLNSNILKTNDLVELKDEKHFRFLGRFDNVINSAGLKIYPEELEELVKKVIPNEAVFFGVKDEILGERLTLVIEGSQTQETDLLLESIVYPSKNHKPKNIFFVKEFPRFANGKINRIQLNNLITTQSIPNSRD